MSFTPSGSGITSSKTSNGSVTDFSSDATDIALGFFGFQLQCWCVILIANVFCCEIKIKTMPPIQNCVVPCRFSPYQKRVIVVCMLLMLNSLHREYWVHPLNEDVHQKDEFFTTYPDLCKYPHKFFRTYSMSICQFDCVQLLRSKTIIIMKLYLQQRDSS